jgi:hypothetical protein
MRIAIFILLGFCLLAPSTGRAQETDRIKELTVEDAKRLAQDKSGRLLLNGLTTLSPEAAKELARFDGWLSLNGLKSLSKEAAEALATHKGPLHLDGLTAISPEVARAQSQHNGELSLKGLTSLPDEVGVALAKQTGGASVSQWCEVPFDRSRQGSGTAQRERGRVERQSMPRRSGVAHG